MLRLDSLPEATLRVFQHLASDPKLEHFTLIGGTAMALQLGHRRSEDLDFWLPAEKLNKDVVSDIVRTAQQAGLQSRLVTPHDQIVTAKINGRDLLESAQDYVIDGVKVTFFARNDGAYRYFDTHSRVNGADAEASFKIMAEGGLFAMKSWVIHQRTRSRDLFDLMHFMRNGKQLDDIFDAGSAADPAYSKEYAKSVMVGDVPLDKEDEGFDSIGVTETVQDVYEHFKTAVDSYEQALAEEAIRDESSSFRP